jgi:DeoR/GlpR family transcriptional regulator of sugar metabolism
MKTLRSLKMIDYLKDRKYCSVDELMTHFDVSPATIHRDISELAKDEIIRRVRGGVSLVQNPSSLEEMEAPSSSFAARMNVNVEKKVKIAEQAVQQIHDGDVIFLDSSTTTLSLARQIQKLSLSRLTIITNSVLILQEFHLFPSNFYLISIGGNFSCQLNSFLGKTAIENLKRLRIDKAFISGVGMTAEGVFTYHEDHAEFLKEVLNASREHYLLLDSTKFNRTGLFEICTLSTVDYVYSDIQVPEYARKTVVKESD